MSPVASVIVNVLWLYLLVLIGRLVFDIVQMLARDWKPKGFVLVIAEIIYTLTDPPLRALRKVIRLCASAGSSWTSPSWCCSSACRS